MVPELDWMSAEAMAQVLAESVGMFVVVMLFPCAAALAGLLLVDPGGTWMPKAG